MNNLNLFNSHPYVAVQCSGYSAMIISICFCYDVLHAIECMSFMSVLSRSARSCPCFFFFMFLLCSSGNYNSILNHWSINRQPLESACMMAFDANLCQLSPLLPFLLTRLRSLERNLRFFA